KRYFHFVSFLWNLQLLHTFEVVEKQSKQDIFKYTPCPAFLVFDNVAHVKDVNLELACRCKPEDVTSVVWYYQKDLERTSFALVLTDFQGLKIVDSSEVSPSSDIEHRFSIRMFSLIIFRTQVEDSGHYICSTSSGDFFYGYDVDVQSLDNAVLIFGDQKQKVQSDKVTKNYRVFTTFWDWTKCDRCGTRGEQRRIGLCYLESKYLYSRYRRSRESVASCGSSSVPGRFKYFIKKRKNEVIIRTCHVPCPTTQIPRAGVGSIQNFLTKLGKKPWLPEVPMQYYVHPLGYQLTLACPGARMEHMVGWDKGKQQLYRSKFLIGRNHSMRVFIDHANQLNIQIAQLDDKGIYYCWLDGVRVAGIRLSISYKGGRSRSISDPETKFALQTVFSFYMMLAGIYLCLQSLKCLCYIFKCPGIN
uniref:Family with sequence similarity 187 member A n=2 Tax=Latimeria chalumnae TaxID=7897 RepID=H3AZP5_LATCH